MSMDNINKWLTLAANIGVLAGIILLTIEIRQTNNIAIYEARTELARSGLDLNFSIIVNSELAEVMNKLQVSGSELNSLEDIKADQVANILLNRAARLNVSLESGFFTEDIADRHIRALLSIIRRYPGIKAYLEIQREGGGVPPLGRSVVFDAIYEEVDRLEN